MRTSSILSLAAFVLLMAAAAPSPAGSARQVEIKVGAQRVFSVPGLTRVSLAASPCADVRPTGTNQFILYGRSEGRTSLIVFRRGRQAENWAVRVVSEAVDRFQANCTDLLGPDGCQGLRVSRAQGKLVLAGRISDLETYHRVRKLKKAYPDLVLLTEVEPTVLDALVTAVNGEFARAGLAGVSVTRVGGRVLLEGTVADEAEKRKAELIVEAMVEEALGSD